MTDNDDDNNNQEQKHPTLYGPPSSFWRPLERQALYAVKVMEISIETEDAVNPKVLKMGP